MVTDQEYVDFARDCVRLAQSADSPELRERLLQMAREWMAAAMHEPIRSRPVRWKKGTMVSPADQNPSTPF